jgi:hypothetical protein
MDSNYLALRKLAVSTTPEALAIKPLGPDQVYGVVMDWDTGDGIVTAVALSTGDASLYFETGGGLIGGGSHANVKTEVAKYLAFAQEALKNTERLQNSTDPVPGAVCFHFLTPSGIRIGQDFAELVQDNRSAWTPLFTVANDVITALRMVQPR